MSSLTELEKRLAAVEHKVTELQNQLQPQPRSWIEEIAGTFKDDPAFQEVIRYGREFREAHPYPDESTP